MIEKIQSFQQMDIHRGKKMNLDKPFTPHKNYLKLDYRHKYKMQNYQTSTR